MAKTAFVDGNPLTGVPGTPITADLMDKLNNPMFSSRAEDGHYDAGWEDVRAWGADPTGVADSTDAIQAAIDSFLTLDADVWQNHSFRRGTVVFPPGKYRTTKALLIRGEIVDETGVNIIGFSADLISTSTTDIITVGTQNARAVQKCKIEGIRFFSDSARCGIRYQGNSCTGNILRNCWVYTTATSRRKGDGSMGICYTSNNAGSYFNEVSDCRIQGWDILESWGLDWNAVSYKKCSIDQATATVSCSAHGYNNNDRVHFRLLDRSFVVASLSNNTFTIKNHPFVTGDAIYASGRSQETSAGTLPSPLVSGTAYYAVVDGTDTIRLSDTYAHAMAGTNIIDLTDIGDGSEHSFAFGVWPTGSGPEVHFFDEYTGYFVVNRTTNTFQVAETQGGAPLAFSTGTFGLIWVGNHPVANATNAPNIQYRQNVRYHAQHSCGIYVGACGHSCLTHVDFIGDFFQEADCDIRLAPLATGMAIIGRFESNARDSIFVECGSTGHQLAMDRYVASYRQNPAGSNQSQPVDRNTSQRNLWYAPEGGTALHVRAVHTDTIQSSHLGHSVGFWGGGYGDPASNRRLIATIGSGSFQFNAPSSKLFHTFSGDDSTPSVGGGDLFYCSANNTAPLHITNFDDGVVGQEIEVYGIGGNGYTNTNGTIISNSDFIKLDGQYDWVDIHWGCITLRYDGVQWIEKHRRNGVFDLLRPDGYLVSKMFCRGDFDLTTGHVLRINGSQVVGAPVTGFVALAGTGSKDGSGINCDTVVANDANIQAIARVLKAVLDACLSHGLLHS